MLDALIIILICIQVLAGMVSFVFIFFMIRELLKVIKKIKEESNVK